MSLENEGGAPSPEPDLSAEDSLREAFAAASESESAKPVEEAPARADGRDDKGRFAPKAAEPAPEPSQTIPQAQPEAQAAPTGQAEPTQPPASWSATAKADWSTLKPHVQQEILKREADVNRGFEARAAELKRYEPLEQLLAPRRDRWSAQGVDEATAVKQLLAASDWLDRDPRSAMQWLMRQYGVHPQHLGAQVQPGQQPGVQTQAQQSPEFRALLTEVQSLKTQLQQRDQAEQDTRRSAVTSEIQTFAADPANIYFHNVKDDMSALLASGRAKDLKDAYDKAVWANPETRQLIQQDQSKKAEAERLAAQRASASEARRASGSVTGSPPAGARSLNGAGPSNDPSDDLRSAWRDSMGRA